MKKRNLLLYYDIFLHLINFTPARKIANLHNVSVQSIYKKINWMEKEGIIKSGDNDTVRKGTKYYIAGPASAAFLKTVEELGVHVEQENRGAILGSALPSDPFTSAPSTSPTLDFYAGKAPHIHRLVFVVDLKRPTSRPGVRYLIPPHLPKSITWVKEWEYRAGYKKLGHIRIVGLDEPAKVQYFRSRKNFIENIMITLPALYVLKEWIERYDDARQYFYELAVAIADEFRKSGYIISKPRPTEQSGEMSFFVPILSELPEGDVKKYIRAQKITDKVWLDFSHGFPEMETRDKKEGKNISEALRMLLELPKMKSKLEEHDQLLHKLIEPQEPVYTPPESAPPGGIYQ